MARQPFLTASTGWDERTQQPLCSVTLWYDDVTLILDSAEVVNGSDDTVATFAVEDTTKAAKDPTRKQAQDVASKLTSRVTRPISPVQLVRIPPERKGDPERIQAPEGWVFSFSGPVNRVDLTKAKDPATKARG